MEEVQGGTVSKDNTNVSTGVGHKTSETWDMGCVKLVGRGLERGGGGGGLWRMRRRLSNNSLHISSYIVPSNSVHALVAGW